MLRRWALLLGLLSAVPIWAQAFEVASIRPSAIAAAGDISRPGVVRSTIEYSADGLIASRYTIRALIAEAYQYPQSRVKELGESEQKILGRPYDVAAKSESPVSREALRLMLQALLADRFQVSFHREAKPEDVYGLVARKGGIKIQKSNAEAENAHYERSSDRVLYYRDASAAKFGELLSSYFGRPVLASNDFEGLYNFPLSPNAAATDDGRDAIINHLQGFGVDLVKCKATLDYLVVDSVATPSEN